MGRFYQLTFDDLNNRELVRAAPQRTAYIDEYGSFGFDFTKEGTSKYYVLCAVVVEDEKLDALHSAVLRVKDNNGFQNAEMKSSRIGNYKRRGHILSELLSIDFHIVLLIADKQKFVRDSPLTDYKTVFIKYLHQRLYQSLYHVYPKLKIIEDEIGTSEFQTSF